MTTTSRPILLVGGVAMKSSSEVFEALASALGNHARRLPDGDYPMARQESVAIGSDGRVRSLERHRASRRKTSGSYPADRHSRSTELSRARPRPTLSLGHSAMLRPLLNLMVISCGYARPAKFRPEPVFRCPCRPRLRRARRS